MFLEHQPKAKIEYYVKMLKAVGSLSRLFSESKEPYLVYRVAENLFCRTFEAKNLSRADCSVDASIGKLGVGIKTFLAKNGRTMEKIAEFNSDHSLFRGLDLAEKVRKISELRNERLAVTKRIYKLDELIYHCIARKKGGMSVSEIPMSSIIVEEIGGVEDRKGILKFSDGIEEYHFNTSKSTLYKRFSSESSLLDFPVDILKDPFVALEEILTEITPALTTSLADVSSQAILPLYSVRAGKKVVSEKSGLNQWNAAGRSRDYNEVYIPVPAWFHVQNPNFFPDRDTPFTLLLPDGQEMTAKICQDGSKALMSNPNSALGRWLLRDVLNLPEGKLLTYRRLEELGLDSVLIKKSTSDRYSIDFIRMDISNTPRDESLGGD